MKEEIVKIIKNEEQGKYPLLTGSTRDYSMVCLSMDVKKIAL
jgi:hypothetical protein